MKISDFCEYFDFCFEAGDFEIKENDKVYLFTEPGHYKYSAYDMQGVFSTRYANDIQDFADMFNSMEEDYVVSVLDGADFIFNDHIDKDYYNQAYSYLKKLPDYNKTDTFHVISVFAGKEKLTI